MPYTSIRLDYDAALHVATLTLNRPDKLNSFTAAMHAELREALGAVAASDSRALILTGAGRAFCAGQDLGELDFTPGARTDLGTLLDTTFNPLVRQLQALPLPVIAAVNGTAAGAGANLALACDLVVAARSSSFIQAFVNLGLLPDAGGTWQLPKRLGLARALGVAMTGDKVSADQALAWGLIWQVVDDIELAAAAARLAARLARQPTRALVAMRHAMRASATGTLEGQLDLERDQQRALGASQDFTEGVAAFIQKRPPAFTGR